MFTQTILSVSIAVILPAAHAVDVIKANNATALNLGASWVDDVGLGDIVPGVNDTVVFNSTIALVGTPPTFGVALGADASWFGIRVTDVGGTRNAAAANPTPSALHISNTGSANTLTIGTGGIDMSVALQALRIDSRILIGADQTWSVANANSGTNPALFNNGEDLSFQANAAGAAFNLGGRTVTTTGAGQICITSGFTISNGTLNIGNNNFVIQGGGSRVTNISSDVALNVQAGGRLHFQSNSGAGGASFASAANINLNGGTLTFASNSTTLTLIQSGNINVLAPSTITVSKTNTNNGNTGPINFTGGLTGSAALTINNDQPTAVNRLNMLGDNSAYSGAVTLTGLAGKTTRMSSATAGSAAAAWTIASGHTLELNGVSVSLGTLNGAGGITNIGGVAGTISVGAGSFGGAISDGAVLNGIGLAKVGAGALALTGTNTYTGATLVDGGALIARTGSLASTTPVTVADGARFGVSLAGAGFSQTIPSLTVGTATGGGVTFDLGTFGNTTIAPLLASTFAPVAGTQVIIAGSGFTNGVGFPLLDYDGAIGGGGFAGLSLLLPPRVIGSLSDDIATTALILTVTGTDTIKWTGLVSTDWDIDGTPGTANWQEVISTAATRYIQTPTGADSVTFDDSAALTNVTLTTVLTPASVTFNNPAKNYTLSGGGRISGTTGIVKNGAGTVRIANTGVNDYAGTTTINEGVIELGDGVTAGAGSLGDGAITNNGALIINRPDGITITVALSGGGALALTDGSLTLDNAAISYAGTVAIGAGRTLTIANAATLSGGISGSGALVKAGAGQLVVGAPGSFTGGTTISAGTILALASDALGTGPIVIGGAARVLLAPGTTHTGNITINANSPGVGLGAIQVNGAVAGNVVIDGSVTVAGAMANGGHIVGTALAGTDALIFDGPLNYSGVTDVSVRTGRVEFRGGGDLPANGAGSLVLTGFGRIGANDGLPIEAVLNLGVSGAADFDLNGFNQTLALLRKNNANAATLTNSSATPGVLTLDTPAVVTAPLPGTQTEGFAGNLTGNLSLVKSGAGTQLFLPASNASFLGAVTVNAGTLDFQGAVSYPGATVISGGTLRTTTGQTGTASFTVAGGATLQVRVAFAGASLLTGALTAEAASRIAFDIGALGNPTIAPLNAPSITTGAGTTLALIGTPAPGVFPLLAYDSINVIGGAGFAGFTLSLPIRVAGNLVDNSAAGTVDVNIIGTDTPKWNGNLSAVWDLDDGTGTGTANWRGDLTGDALTYLQSPGGTDRVIFDDSATGATTISLSTTLTPLGLAVNNSALNYTFTGAGKISGAIGITKDGTGTLTVRNTAINDFTGGTVINAGTLVLGDGATAGAGTLGTGAVTVNGTLVISRPDDFTLTNTLLGTGTIVKEQANTITIPVAAAYGGPLAINTGTLLFNAGGTLTGLLSGAGALTNSAATLQLGGVDANTNTGLITSAGGIVQLNKPTGTSATGGNIVITGTGQIELLAGEQIADSATVTLLGSSANSILSAAGLGTETVANLIVNSSVGGATGGQIIMRNGMTVTGTGTINSGILGVASAHTATINHIAITAPPGNAGILRIAGSGANSTLNIGAGGITASGGEIQVKFNGNNFDAIVNLGGDFTATGNVAITNAGYTGTNLNVINLIGTRIFDIADGTITTIAPDLGDTTGIGGPVGGLAKTGGGTLLLTSTVGATYTGGTTLGAGILEIAGSLSGSSVVVNGGTLAGTGSILTGPLGFDFNAGGHIAPGPTGAIGTLTINTDTNALDLAGGIAPIASAALLFDLGDPIFSDRIFIPTGTLSIGAGLLEFDDFVFTAQPGFVDQQTYTLFDTSSPIAGSLGANRFGFIAGLQAELQFAAGGNDLILFVPEPASALLLLGGLALGARRRRK